MLHRSWEVNRERHTGGRGGKCANELEAEVDRESTEIADREPVCRFHMRHEWLETAVVAVTVETHLEASKKKFFVLLCDVIQKGCL